MKVLFVHNRYKFKGGEDTVLEAESALLRGRGHQVRILEFDNDDIGGLFSKVTAAAGSFYNVRSARRLKKEAAAFVPDVIHFHNLFFSASPSVLITARRLGIPVVITIHNYRLICANALLLRNNRICELCVPFDFPVYGARYKCYHSSAVESALVTGITGIHKKLSTWNDKSDQVIVPSHFLKEKLVSSSAGIDPEKIVVKPNFTEDVFRDVAKESFFLFAGRLTAEKGIDVLLSAFESAAGMRLVIAGDGPERDNVLQRISGKDHIQYVGLQPKEGLLDLMRRSQALIFPSIWYEGLPMTIVEAFSTGTPVIASKLGAMTEMIIDGVNGFHFSAGDSLHLNDCLLRFERLNDAERLRLSRQARSTYLEKYHPDIHYRDIIFIYQKAIEVSRSL